MRKKGMNANLLRRNTAGKAMVSVRVPWGWEVSPKTKFLMSLKRRNASRNVFVLAHPGNFLDSGMLFIVSWLLESYSFSLMIPGPPYPKPAVLYSVMFILQCFPVSPAWSNIQGYYSLQIGFLDNTEHSVPCPLQHLSLFHWHIQMGRCPNWSCLTRASTCEDSWHHCASQWRCTSYSQSALLISSLWPEHFRSDALLLLALVSPNCRLP